MSRPVRPHRIRPIHSGILWLAVVSLSALATACQAQGDLEMAEQSPFELSLFTSAQVPAFLHSMDIYAEASALFGHGPMGMVRVALPEGLSLVAGDTVFAIAVQALAPPRRFTVRAERPGRYEVRATMVIDSASGDQDLFDVGLPVVVTGDTLTASYSIVHRAETRHNGQRFRYSDGWLVPIDDTEAFDAVDFERTGVRSRALETPAAVCSDCSRAGVDTLLFVVAVDPRGAVRSSMLAGRIGEKAYPHRQAAGRAALSKWRFEPARCNGQPVTDLAHVRIPMIR